MKLHWKMKKPLPLPLPLLMADKRGEVEGENEIFNGVCGMQRRK